MLEGEKLTRSESEGEHREALIMVFATPEPRVLTDPPKPHPYLKPSCGQPLVLVMKATQHGVSNDPAPRRRAGPSRWS